MTCFVLELSLQVSRCLDGAYGLNDTNLNLVKSDQKVLKIGFQLLFSLKVLFLTSFLCLSSYLLVHVKFKMFPHRSFFGIGDEPGKPPGESSSFPCLVVVVQ